MDRQQIQAAIASACQDKKRKRRQPTEEERQIKRAKKVQKAAAKADNNAEFEIDFCKKVIEKTPAAAPVAVFKKPEAIPLRRRGYHTGLYDAFKSESRGLNCKLNS